MVIESCIYVRVNAVEGDNGKLFTVGEFDSNVIEYSEGKRRCLINTKLKGDCAISWALNAAAKPDFLHRNESGEYEAIDAEYIKFECVCR